MYVLHHILIGTGILLAVIAMGFPAIDGAVVATTIYLLRELYQYYALDKTHNGKFDHSGWMPVAIVTFTIALLLKSLNIVG